MHVDEYHDTCGWIHCKQCKQQDQVSHFPLQDPSDTDIFSSGRCFPCCLIGSEHGLFRDDRHPSTLEFLRRSLSTWIENTKLFGFPAGCSFFDRDHNLRKMIIPRHATKNFCKRNSNLLHLACLFLFLMICRCDGEAYMIVSAFKKIVFADLVAVFHGLNICIRIHTLVVQSFMIWEGEDYVGSEILRSAFGGMGCILWCSIIKNPKQNHAQGRISLNFDRNRPNFQQ